MGAIVDANFSGHYAFVMRNKGTEQWHRRTAPTTGSKLNPFGREQTLTNFISLKGSGQWLT
ncbi:hypothetical protein OCK02_14155 [Rhizobium sp. TRM96647]|uniref:hypothetical protein n=1 Tax=unclassified Rhizobium TaxID=2613769 RepID=UPI0021E78E23|nr:MULTISPECIES: hypothetical protein [unclassified Rhizobium]MCV3737356.1 hypothetical protein [Rhizobium sp. TRM96647]MCV3759340.1 hypothetical protein [Rhizobium sp. TRM96650]